LIAKLPFILEALVQKRVPDVLFEHRGITVAELAKKTSCDASVLYRMLRRASTSGFFRELPALNGEEGLLSHRFENSPESDNLREGHPSSARYGLIHFVNDISPTYIHLAKLLDDPKAREKERRRLFVFVSKLGSLSRPTCLRLHMASSCGS
jgi:hypothetical protein